jgi:hypothetical protein
VRKLVVASSMSIYGEGLYTDADGHEVEPPERTREQLAAREWDYAGFEPAPDAGAQAAGINLDLCADEVRPGTRVVSVRDAARAFALAVEQDGANGLAVNVGSGRSVTVRDLAAQLGAVVGREFEPEITGESRVGDIRHCFADVQLAQETLGYVPEVELADGMAELAAWLEGQTAEDRVDAAAAELTRRGLAR